MNQTLTVSDAPVLRPVIVKAVAVCIAVAIAPWFTGGQEPVALVIATLSVLLGALLLWRQPSVRRLGRGPLVWSYFGLVGWSAMSLIWSVNRYSSALWLLQLVIAGMVFGLSYRISREQQGRELLLGLYAVSAVGFCVYALWLYLTGAYPRLTGSFYWANPAAAYLIPLIIISLSRLTGRRWQPWCALLVLSGTAFVLSDSRGATLVLMLVLVPYVLSVVRGRSHWLKIVLSLFLVVVATFAVIQIRDRVVGGVNSTTPGSRFKEAALGESQSGRDRLDYLSSAVRIWADNPLLGTGAGTFRDVHPGYQNNVVSASTNAHNYFIQTLSELGVIGFILLLSITTVMALGLVRGLWSVTGTTTIVAAVAALLLHMGLDIDADYPALLGLLGLLAGLGYSQGPYRRSAPSWLLPGVPAAMMVIAVSVYIGGTAADRAQLFAAEGDLETAADLYARAGAGLVADPDWLNGEGIARYGLSLGEPASSGESKLALRRALKAQQLDSWDAQHHELEGRIKAHDGNLVGAVRAFKRALELDPHNHPEYAYDLARVQLALGYQDEAVTTAKTMLDRYPRAVVENRSADSTLKPSLVGLAAFIGTQNLARGDLEGAVTASKLAASFDPKDFRTKGLMSAIARSKSAAAIQLAPPE